MPRNNRKSAKRRRVSSSKRRSMRNMRRKKGGQCGCGSGLGMLSNTPSPASSALTSFLRGGGPTPGLGELSGKHFYPLNNFNADPNYGMVDSRQAANVRFTGGKKRRRSSRKKGGTNITGAMLNGLNTATTSALVGANSYSSGSPFFASPYEKYTVLNPPLA